MATDSIEDRVRKQTPVDTNPASGTTANTPQFVFEKVAGHEGVAQKIHRMVPLEAVMVEYTDDDGKKQVRVCFAAKGEQGGVQPYILRMVPAAGDPIVVEPPKWFVIEFGRAYATHVGETSSL